MDAQQEALEVAGRALDVEGWNEDEQPEANQRLEAALVDVRDSWKAPRKTRGISWKVNRRLGREVAEGPVLLKAALAYARRGILVFPCEPGDKAPLTYSGFWDATTDARSIRAWWNRWPRANVGVPTGERSGLLVLDVDPRDGGSESLVAPELINGALPRTAKARTGGGGVHMFFRYPKGEEVRNSAGRLGPGLDVRGEGGYIVVPPSRTQSAYEWLDRTSPADSTWLLECLRSQPSGERKLF